MNTNTTATTSTSLIDLADDDLVPHILTGWRCPGGIGRHEIVLAELGLGDELDAEIAGMRARRAARQARCGHLEHCSGAGCRCPACGKKYTAVLGADAGLRGTACERVQARHVARAMAGVRLHISPVAEDLVAIHPTGGGLVCMIAPDGTGHTSDMMRGACGDTAYRAAAEYLARRGYRPRARVQRGDKPVDIQATETRADGSRVWSF